MDIYQDFADLLIAQQENRRPTSEWVFMISDKMNNSLTGYYRALHNREIMFKTKLGSVYFKKKNYSKSASAYDKKIISKKVRGSKKKKKDADWKRMMEEDGY